MSKNTRKILVTNALTYANGPLHLGHLLEYIQTDIWVRFQKMIGRDCIYVSGNDAHGTPIMIAAEKAGLSPEELVNHIHHQHQVDLNDFLINFDNFYTTHSTENQVLSNLIYERLFERGDIASRVIQQAFDPVKQIFLPDRYVKGECPRCGAKDQYGDNCENCGATYSPTELKNPISVLSGAAPIQKESLHYFFKLENYEDMLCGWLQANEHVQPEITNKLMEWFKAGLTSWDISRDSPYFGFEIPQAPGKYFYVWLDAPIGYMASFKNLCDKRGLNFEEYWNENSETELYHFIGKDIVYFHALFWPAMLTGSQFRKPTSIFCHGFLTINGQKMSKSRGTFITVRQYLDHLNPEYLRYYFAAKLSSHIDDIDLNFDDFIQRVNSDLVGKVVNIASRCAGFMNKLFDNRLSSNLDDSVLWEEFVKAGDEIATHYKTREFNRAVREIMNLADRANQYIDEKKPWVLAKQSDHLTEVQSICSMGLNLFKIIITYLSPILPKMAEASADFLQTEAFSWENRKLALLNHTIAEFKPLMQRVQRENIEVISQNSQSLLRET